MRGAGKEGIAAEVATAIFDIVNLVVHNRCAGDAAGDEAGGEGGRRIEVVDFRAGVGCVAPEDGIDLAGEAVPATYADTVDCPAEVGRRIVVEGDVDEGGAAD